MLLMTLPWGAFVHSHVPLIFPVCLSCLKVMTATRTFGDHLAASGLLPLAADSQSLQVLGVLIGGLKRCTDCRFIQKHSPGNKDSTDQMCHQPAVNSRSLSILKGTGYCLGPVQEFLAKGCAVGAGLDTESLCSAQGARPSHHASSDSNRVNIQLCIGKGGRESSPRRDYLTSCACTQSRSSQTSPAPSS